MFLKKLYLSRFRNAFGLFFLAAVMLVPFQIRAAGLAQTPCDPGYYKSMEARAWLEAQREITQNQNLIFKPDSVLEYTCFDGFLNELADHASDMFSETKRWSGVNVGDMQGTLDFLVGQALINYINMNFNHTYLGDRSGFDSNIKAVSRSRAYNCEDMQKIWDGKPVSPGAPDTARCMNIWDNPKQDGFFSFLDYRDDPKDKRFKPDYCPGIQGTWGTNIADAGYNDPKLDAAGQHVLTPWEEDDTMTYLGLLDPANCPNAAKIRSGIKVERAKMPAQGFDEYICIPAGCVYVPAPSGGPGLCKKSP